MSERQPLLLVESASVTAAAEVATGYAVAARPTNGAFDASEFSDRKVILWPDASPESRTEFKALAERITDLCLELKFIIPNGKPAGWNIAQAKAEGMSWSEIAAWAKGSMLIFERGMFPRMDVQVSEKPDPIPASVEAIWDSLGLARSENGAVIANADNVVRLLAGWAAFKDMLWYDEFYGRYFTHDEKGRPREWQDIDDINLTVLLQREFGFRRITERVVSPAVRCRAYQCLKNEPKDWLATLQWDGKERVDKFFSYYFGAERTGYTAAVSRNFWIGMVARVYQPGCQLDNMVILEGAQGIYKSKALEAIGGKWYMEASEELTSKDFFVAMAGKLVIEVADLDSFSRAETTRIKKVITCRTDRYRQPYARATQDFPRRSIFVGTTNEEHYLKDNTGARRFWPIACTHIRLEDIRAHRTQLFAEAVTRYLTGEDWYKMPLEETSLEQESRRQYDEWENVIQHWIIGKSDFTLTELATHMNIEKGKLDMNSQRRMGAILRRCGWRSKPARREGGLVKVWFPSEPDLRQLPLTPESLPGRV